MLAQLLRLDTSGSSDFVDVAGDPHAGAIAALADAGVVNGYPDGTFRSARPLTRGQTASLLARAAGLPGVAVGPFTDTAASTNHGAINAVAAAGLVAGFPDGTYRPDQLVTRAQIASVLVGLIDALDPH
jgi:subtilisin